VSRTRRAFIEWMALLTTVVVAGLGLATPAHAVANGSLVSNGQYPFSAKLTMTGITRSDGTRYNSACSAALISPSWVITAGHCFHDGNRTRISGPPKYETTATVGRTDPSTADGYNRTVTYVRQSPIEDVALAQLDRPVTGIRPLSLSTTAPKVGDLVRMTGWGATSSMNPAPATRLRTGQFKIRRVTSATVGVVGYAPKANTSACPYDSGAPYFVERSGGTTALVSLESYGPACPHSQEETTARIDVLADWIRQNTVSAHR
jgi:secreted trypsin-like serine protease